MHQDVASPQLNFPINAAIAAAGIGGIVAGFANWGAPWGPSLLVAGGLLAGCALVGWWARSWLPATLSALAAIALGMVIIGLSVRATQPVASAALLAAGVLGLIAAIATATIVHLVLRAANERATSEPDPRPLRTAQQQSLAPLAGEQLARLEHLLHDALDRISISEAARDEFFPPRDLEVIHQRLEQALASGDIAGAELVVTSAQTLGHAGLVPAWRNRIDEEKRRVRDAQAAGPMQEFETSLHRRDWAAAFQHAAAVRAISPDPATAQHLELRVQAARQEHKHALEEQFQQARERDDVETAMATLKELDKYMTRDEAERLSREAQRVIQRHRERLTTTFQAAVQEKRWSDAARVGNAIIAEYPNTRMAEEVRTMIEVIRTRATQTALARE